MQDPIQISYDEHVERAVVFGAYNHKGITMVPHPVTGTPCRMALMPESPVGTKARVAQLNKAKRLRKTLRTTAREQWSIDRKATTSEKGYAKLMGLTMSHIYAQPATGRAQQV